MTFRSIVLALSLGFIWVGAGARGNDVQSVQFPVPDAGPTLSGFLRRPDGTGPFPAVVLMHGCGGGAARLDQNWGARLQDWGYMTLTVDSFGPRGIKVACSGEPPLRLLDAYGALEFLAHEPTVDASRVAVMGFSQGGINALQDIEQGGVAGRFPNRFRAAVAFYPLCAASGAFTVPTLIINGDLDDWSSADACRKMVAQEGDIGISRSKQPSAPAKLLIIPQAAHDFDNPDGQQGTRYLGHLLQYNAAATEQAAAATHDFLQTELGR